MDFPEKVLLIDDDEEEHFIFTVALNECCQGIKLTCEKSANLALTRMENDETYIPDLIILDWSMPEISGREVLSRIRTLPRYTHIPIVIFTGFPDPVHLDEAKEPGGTFFLRKPFDFSELCRKLAYLFSLNWRDTESPGQQI